MIAVATALAFARTVGDYVEADGVLPGLWGMALYYTHWAVGITALVFAAIACGIRGAGRPVMLGGVLVLLAILLVHYWLFKGIADYLASPLRSRFVHGPLPVLVLAYWAAFTRGGTLRWSDPLRWTVIPLVYTFYGLVRGAATGVYPYEIADVRHYGYPLVIALVIATTAAAIAFGMLVVLIDRLRARGSGDTDQPMRLTLPPA